MSRLNREVRRRTLGPYGVTLSLLAVLLKACSPEFPPAGVALRVLADTLDEHGDDAFDGDVVRTR